MDCAVRPAQIYIFFVVVCVKGCLFEAQALFCMLHLFPFAAMVESGQGRLSSAMKSKITRAQIDHACRVMLTLGAPTDSQRLSSVKEGGVASFTASNQLL